MRVCLQIARGRITTSNVTFQRNLAHQRIGDEDHTCPLMFDKQFPHKTRKSEKTPWAHDMLGDDLPEKNTCYGRGAPFFFSVAHGLMSSILHRKKKQNLVKLKMQPDFEKNVA